MNNLGRACIADFGLATVLTGMTLVYSHGTVLPGCTPQWFSPELLNPGAQPTKASDVWAFGLVCYEVCGSDSFGFEFSLRFHELGLYATIPLSRLRK